MKCSWRKLAMAVACSLALSGSALAVPNAIHYAGELMAQNGLPYSGTVAVKARVFAGMSGGTALSEEDLGDVLVQNGVLEIDLTTLGQHTGMDDLWLEFEVDGETLAPRQKVTSVAFAHRAGDADTLGGMPPSAFLQGQGAIAPDALPTNAIAQVSNNALANEFADVTWEWPSGPKDIQDFPGLPAQAIITTDETGSTYLTSLTIYTQFSLIANTKLTMVLVPPSGTGVGPITLVNSSQTLTSNTYTASWTPGNTPELAPLIGAEVKGDWVLTITDVTDDLIGTTKTGALESFQIVYDVVRSDELDMNGDLTVKGNLHVEGTITGGGVERSGDTFTRWARDTCPAGSELLYAGRAFVGHHTHSGSGDMLCVKPNDPGPSTSGSTYDLLYGASLANFGQLSLPFGGSPGIACAVCYVPENGPCFDMWGSQTCPTGFKSMYAGYTFGSYYQHNLPAQRICVDTANYQTGLPDNSGYLYPTAMWSSSNESQFATSRHLKCAKCCRE